MIIELKDGESGQNVFSFFGKSFIKWADYLLKQDIDIDLFTSKDVIDLNDVILLKESTKKVLNNCRKSDKKWLEELVIALSSAKSIKIF